MYGDGEGDDTGSFYTAMENLHQQPSNGSISFAQASTRLIEIEQKSLHLALSEDRGGTKLTTTARR